MAGDPPSFFALAGYRASGKTAVGCELAGQLGYQFVDTDRLIETDIGEDIASFFAQHGEAAFRDKEAAVIRSLVSRRHLVVALGGGAVLREENCRQLRAVGPIVWLRASADTIRDRLAADHATASQRPSLTGAGTAAEVERVLAERIPIYASVADFTLDTDDMTPDELAAVIASWWE